MNELPDYFKYWGKAEKDGNRYHLLPYHCLDVAAVGFLLLDEKKPLCQRLASSLDVSPAWLQKWFSFCLTRHDLGKFATAFQGQVTGLSDCLVPPNSRMPYSVRHDTLGFILWQDVIINGLLRAGGFGYEPNDSGLRKLLRAFTPWLEITTGHHGVPPQKGEQRIRHQESFTENDEKAAWSFFCAATDLLLDDISLDMICEKEFKKRLKLVSWQLAGIVVLSDWLGSSLESTDYHSEKMDLGTYWRKHALPGNANLLEKAKLTPSNITPFSRIENLFPFIKKATPLQQWAESVKIGNKSQLFILEDVTGSGKTEAALILAHRLMSQGAADGLYVALPTMATANAMYDRLGTAYKNWVIV